MRYFHQQYSDAIFWCHCFYSWRVQQHTNHLNDKYLLSRLSSISLCSCSSLLHTCHLILSNVHWNPLYWLKQREIIVVVYRFIYLPINSSHAMNFLIHKHKTFFYYFFLYSFIIFSKSFFGTELVLMIWHFFK